MPDNGNVPAFPVPWEADENGMRGLTKREEFAKAAMQGLLATDFPTRVPQDVARDAVAHANALLAELEKREAGG